MFKKWLSLYAFNRAITPYDPCGGTVGVFVPESDCLEEGSRIVGAFACKTSLDIESLTLPPEVDGTYADIAAMLADQSNQSEGDKFRITGGSILYTLGAASTGAIEDYTTSTINDIEAAVGAGNMRVISGLAGNWTPGTSNKKPGKGYNREKHSSFTYSIPLSHYSVDGNLGFWNQIDHQVGWSLVFVFEDLAAWAALSSEKKLLPMDITMTPASDDELGGQRRFEGTASWTTRGLPYLVTAPVVAAFTKEALAEYFK